MQAQTLPRAIAAGAALIAAGLVLLLARAPIDEPLPIVLLDERSAPAESERSTPSTGADRSAPVDEAARAANVRELEQMSETFRNSTFLIAIREAGFVCNELLHVFGGIDDSGKWIARCSEMLSYTVGVTGDGTLRVEPMMQYFDGPLSQPITSDGPAPVLPPGPR